MTTSIPNVPGSDEIKGLTLTYLVRKPTVKSTKQKAIILLHGVGSNEQDLFSLANQLPAAAFIIFPRGQFSLGVGRYAWYNVDFSTGKPIINKQQEASSRELIRTFIKQVKKKYNLDDLYLGGFSQGAIMSYSVGLIYPDEVNGIILLSGRILDEISTLIKKKDYLIRLKVFIAHGLQDNVLPIHYARAAKEYLENAGIHITYHEYQTGHQISTPVLNDLNNWLK
ncbi:MAG: alpha/beta hydrolase [Ginsengibacter sp.]